MNILLNYSPQVHAEWLTGLTNHSTHIAVIWVLYLLIMHARLNILILHPRCEAPVIQINTLTLSSDLKTSLFHISEP